ncbi:multicopper oxidase family protein [Cryobacterium psychrophilum]|uniref:multicopper oxidase family protein n=1 Tax=Cryobacterium psychrophilum TaxID=41988 RepID=UPI0010E7404B|nr:multicopper oxidase family protein [Cryobacterium psychrophilum]TDW28867.1 FtsP/CotA-like multicopper oxidase with cupredoxin domain [Cryobacterium psychrophilum]
MNNSLTRRTFLGATLATATTAALAACATPSPSRGVTRILATDPMVGRFEDRRTASGRITTQQLTAGAFDTTVSGMALATWGYNNALNGPVIRARTGDLLDVAVTNNLNEATSIHWHGLALRNNADGVPGVTQKAIAAGADSSYKFRLTHPGTYWYHSHVDMQRERALSGALVIEDPNEALSYDQEWVIVLDDWLDGISGRPEGVLARLAGGMDMSGMNMSESPMLMGSSSAYLGGDAGDVRMPAHLFNGKTATEPEIFPSKPGNRIRLRIINASGDTAYRVGVPGRKIALTHADGFPVKHVDVDAVVLGMGERIDAILTVTDAFTPLMALPEGKDGSAWGLINAGGAGAAPQASSLPSSLDGVVTDGGRLKADESVILNAQSPDRIHTMRLTGSMDNYSWGINGNMFNPDRPFADAFDIAVNERVQVKIINDTSMWHPMHLHGHSFQISGNGARKDTVIVRPKETVTFEFDADNPGQWLTHCHNAYHAAKGMMGVFSYVR